METVTRTKIPFKKYDSIYDIIARILSTPNGIVYMQKVNTPKKIKHSELVKILAYMQQRGFIRGLERKQLPEDFARTTGKYYLVKGLGYEYLERYKKLVILL